MTTISILPDNRGHVGICYRAVAGALQSVGRTPGEALDALTPQLNEADSGTLVVVQQLRPDRFFTAAQQQRLAELIQRRQTALAAQTALPVEEETELNALVEAELHASAERAAVLANQLKP